jgi:hypothetical protein
MVHLSLTSGVSKGIRPGKTEAGVKVVILLAIVYKIKQV